MPISVRVKDDGAFIHVKAEGRVKSEDILGMLESIKNNEDVKPGHVTLFDALGVSGEDLDLEDYNFDRVIEEEKRNPEKLIARKLAIVARNLKVVVYAMRYQLLAEEIGELTAIFNDVHEATLWLKL